MRNRVTSKVVAITAFAIGIITFALLIIMWQWQTANADRIETDYTRQVINAVTHADPASLSAGGEGAAETVLDALPSNVRLRSLLLKDRDGGTIVWQSTEESDSLQDDPVIDAASYLSVLPDHLTVTADVRIPRANGKSPITRMRAVLDLTGEKAEAATQIAEVLQIFFPVTLMCLLAVYLGIRHWVQRPAEAIIRVANRIAGGDQGLRLAISSRDEFGKIMCAFNDLTDALLATQHQADTDGLTGVFNHRYLQEHIGESLQAATQSGRSMAIILIDLNKFKVLNDTYGHLVGDRYLQQTASVLRRAVHLDGIVGRYGGDEFMIVLSHAGCERAQQAALRIRSLMGSEQFRPDPVGPALPILFSMGVAIFPDNGRSAAELIAYADASLYTEKQGGSNLVELIREIESEYAQQCGDSARSAQPGGLFGTLMGLVVAVDNKDSYTKRHSLHVADWAVRLGQAAGVPRQTLRALQVAGLLHDVGKIGIPDTILRKPSELTPQEEEIMAGHVALSERLIQEVPYQDAVLQAVSSHHERWDGEGYPRRLKGKNTPVSGRIMAVVNAYSAMCLGRVHGGTMTASEICEQLRRGAGIEFDRDLVEKLIGLIANVDPGDLSSGPDLEPLTPLQKASSNANETSDIPEAA